MPRFVVLRHNLPTDSTRASHFDLLFEQGAVLRAWACERIPAFGQSVPAEQLADHRLAYLDYEGPISGNRGSVTRIDAGEYELLVDLPEQFRVKIAGQRLPGILTLTRENADAQRWSVGLSAD